MSNQEYTTDFIWDTICNDESLYNSMRDKMRRKFFIKRTAVFTPVFNDIIIDAKQIAKSLDQDADLRRYSPKLMQVNLSQEYQEFVSFQKYMAEKIEALPFSKCFITISDFLKQRHTIKRYSQLIEELLTAISFIDDSLTEDYPKETEVILLTFRSHLNEWLTFAKRKV